MQTTEVRERPILFSGPMVNAILCGRKTMTRRALKPQPHTEGGTTMWRHSPNHGCGCSHPPCECWLNECPYGQPGDHLWVRESWAPLDTFDPEFGVMYRADSHKGMEKRDGDQKWKPSIHMRRKDSRIDLEITEVRVERLNEISEEDAKAEGIFKVAHVGDEPGQFWWGSSPMPEPYNLETCKGFVEERSPVAAFQKLWEKINGPDSWNENPWVWVVSFRKLTK